MKFLRDFLKGVLPGRLYRSLQSVYHYALACAAAYWYGNPSRRLGVIGVTGTNGKTTVVHLLHEMFFTAGVPVASLSSLRFKIKGAEEPNLLKMTMPGRFELQKFLSASKAAGCRTVILEVTSEGLAQHRGRFTQFRAAVMTNVTPEHIEAHGSFEAYRDAKCELFRMLPPDGMAIINAEDPAYELFRSQTRAGVATYSRSGIEVAGLGRPVRVIRIGPDAVELELDNIVLVSHLGGEFNFMNILAAATTAIAFGISLSSIAEALRRFSGVPGRLEFVQREPFRVVVDYAHTPDALERVYQTLSSANSKLDPPAGRAGTRNSKLVCVLGSAGGGRDKWKRPQMGRIAGEHCGHVILTSEDPDDEDPAVIANQIKAGISQISSAIVETLLDRREAIRKAIALAQPGDTVIMTGMGAQPWFVDRGGKKIPWDEPAIVREELDKQRKH